MGLELLDTVGGDGAPGGLAWLNLGLDLSVDSSSDIEVPVGVTIDMCAILRRSLLLTANNISALEQWLAECARGERSGSCTDENIEETRRALKDMKKNMRDFQRFYNSECVRKVVDPKAPPIGVPLQILDWEGFFAY
jgi:hypothetical protein